MPKVFQDFIYGYTRGTPAFNVVSIFFGIGQQKLPKSNPPRIVLMTFIMFCLVIRTAYQGVLFEMITSDMKKTNPASIEEMFERNYTVYFPSMFFVHEAKIFLNKEEVHFSFTTFYDMFNERQKLVLLILFFYFKFNLLLFLVGVK
jgi:hypothetical protein